MKGRKEFLAAVLVLAVAAIPVIAQDVTEQDPAITQAKEETVVVYDLGRFFGYVMTVEKDNPELSLKPDQLETLYAVMKDILAMDRIEPDWADEKLEYLELDILSVDQLIAVDELAIARLESRDSDEEGTEQKKGGGTGSGPLQTYVAGGAFNPIIDDTKSIGEGFMELFSYISDKLGK